MASLRRRLYQETKLLSLWRGQGADYEGTVRNASILSYGPIMEVTGLPELWHKRFPWKSLWPCFGARLLISE